MKVLICSVIGGYPNIIIKAKSKQALPDYILTAFYGIQLPAKNSRVLFLGLCQSFFKAL